MSHIMETVVQGIEGSWSTVPTVSVSDNVPVDNVTPIIIDPTHNGGSWFTVPSVPVSDNVPVDNVTPVIDVTHNGDSRTQIYEHRFENPYDKLFQSFAMELSEPLVDNVTPVTEPTHNGVVVNMYVPATAETQNGDVVYTYVLATAETQNGGLLTTDLPAAAATQNAVFLSEQAVNEPTVIPLHAPAVNQNSGGYNIKVLPNPALQNTGIAKKQILTVQPISTEEALKYISPGRIINKPQNNGILHEKNKATTIPTTNEGSTWKTRIREMAQNLPIMGNIDLTDDDEVTFVSQYRENVTPRYNNRSISNWPYPRTKYIPPSNPIKIQNTQRTPLSARNDGSEVRQKRDYKKLIGPNQKEIYVPDYDFTRNPDGSYTVTLEGKTQKLWKKSRFQDENRSVREALANVPIRNCHSARRLPLGKPEFNTRSGITEVRFTPLPKKNTADMINITRDLPNTQQNPSDGSQQRVNSVLEVMAENFANSQLTITASTLKNNIPVFNVVYNNPPASVQESTTSVSTDSVVNNNAGNKQLFENALPFSIQVTVPESTVVNSTAGFPDVVQSTVTPIENTNAGFSSAVSTEVENNSIPNVPKLPVPKRPAPKLPAPKPFGGRFNGRRELPESEKDLSYLSRKRTTPMPVITKRRKLNSDSTQKDNTTERVTGPDNSHINNSTPKFTNSQSNNQDINKQLFDCENMRTNINSLPCLGDELEVENFLKKGRACQEKNFVTKNTNSLPCLDDEMEVDNFLKKGRACQEKNSATKNTNSLPCLDDEMEVDNFLKKGRAIQENKSETKNRSDDIMHLHSSNSSGTESSTDDSVSTIVADSPRRGTNPYSNEEKFREYVIELRTEENSSLSSGNFMNPNNSNSNGTESQCNDSSSSTLSNSSSRTLSNSSTRTLSTTPSYWEQYEVPDATVPLNLFSD